MAITLDSDLSLYKVIFDMFGAPEGELHHRLTDDPDGLYTTSDPEQQFFTRHGDEVHVTYSSEAGHAGERMWTRTSFIMDMVEHLDDAERAAKEAGFESLEDALDGDDPVAVLGFSEEDRSVLGDWTLLAITEALGIEEPSDEEA